MKFLNHIIEEREIKTLMHSKRIETSIYRRKIAGMCPRWTIIWYESQNLQPFVVDIKE